LRKKKSPERAGQVLVVDASAMFRKGRAQNYLDPEHVAEVLKWVQEYADVENRVRLVSLNEIKAEDWTLNISRYVLPPLGEDIPNLNVAIEDFKAAWEKAQAAENKLRDMLREDGWIND
jgi:type I restriction enzyme M protein